MKMMQMPERPRRGPKMDCRHFFKITDKIILECFINLPIDNLNGDVQTTQKI